MFFRGEAFGRCGRGALATALHKRPSAGAFAIVWTLGRQATARCFIEAVPQREWRAAGCAGSVPLRCQGTRPHLGS